MTSNSANVWESDVYTCLSTAVWLNSTLADPVADSVSHSTVLAGLWVYGNAVMVLPLG